MKQASSNPGSGGFSDLEERFFESAPPDVPVAPPPAMTFDDLVGPPRRAAAARKARRAPAQNRRTRTPRATGAWRATLSLLGATALGRARVASVRARVAVARAVAWSIVTAKDEWARAVPALRRALESVGPALRAARNRLAAELPNERPDRSTALGALAAVVIVFGLSATVLARGGFRLAPSRPSPPAQVTEPAP